MICLAVFVQFCVVWMVTVAIMCGFGPGEAISCLSLLISGGRTHVARFLYLKLQNQSPDRLVSRFLWPSNSLFHPLNWMKMASGISSAGKCSSLQI